MDRKLKASIWFQISYIIFLNSKVVQSSEKAFKAMERGDWNRVKEEVPKNGSMIQLELDKQHGVPRRLCHAASPPVFDDPLTSLLFRTKEILCSSRRPD